MRTSSTMPAAASALNLSRAATSSSRSACWTRRSTAAQPAPARGRWRDRRGGDRQARAVEPFLDAGDALIVDVDVTDEVGDLAAVGIDALVLVEEADARNAEAVDLLLLGRRDLPLEPGEAAPGGEPVAHLAAVEIGHHAGQQLGRLVGIDDAPRLGETARASSDRWPEARHCDRGCRDAPSPPRPANRCGAPHGYREAPHRARGAAR